MTRERDNLGAPQTGRHTASVAAPDRSSPFTLHAVDASGQLAGPDVSGGIRVEQVERLEQPWGYEETFAILEGRYVSRLLQITEGGMLPLRKRLTNDTTLYLQTGQITLTYGADPARLKAVTMQPGQRMLIPANLLHQVTAAVASTLLETSTAWPGWRTDVVEVPPGR